MIGEHIYITASINASTHTCWNVAYAVPLVTFNVESAHKSLLLYKDQPYSSHSNSCMLRLQSKLLSVMCSTHCNFSTRWIVSVLTPCMRTWRGPAGELSTTHIESTSWTKAVNVAGLVVCIPALSYIRQEETRGRSSATDRNVDDFKEDELLQIIKHCQRLT